MDEWNGFNTGETVRLKGSTQTMCIEAFGNGLICGSGEPVRHSHYVLCCWIDSQGHPQSKRYSPILLERA